MEETTSISEKERFSERFYGWMNNVLTTIENSNILTVIVVGICIFIVFVLVYLFCTKKIIRIGPFEFDFSKFSKEKDKPIKQRRITDLPAPKPANAKMDLPYELEQFMQELKHGNKRSILIQSDNRYDAEELGKLLYYKLNERKICDKIGWLHYDKNNNKYGTIEKCIEQEFSIYKDIKDYYARRAKRLDFLDDDSHHIVLFVNIVEYDEKKDCEIERYNNLKGLSMVLISKTNINGYETYSMNKKGGDLLCNLKN